MTHAPPFSAPPLAGLAPVSLASLLSEGPVVLAFFEISCPTCQVAFPFLERLHASGHTGLQFIGVSQDNPVLTRQFASHFGVTFPLLLDTAVEAYTVSNSYGLTHVPSTFVVETDGAITHSWIGFSKADFERLAERAGAPVFQPGERVPEWKPG